MNLFLELISGKIFTKYCSYFKLYSHLRRKSKHDKFDRVHISRKEQQHECKCMIQSQNSFLNKFLASCATYQLAENHKGIGLIWSSLGNPNQQKTDNSNRDIVNYSKLHWLQLKRSCRWRISFQIFSEAHFVKVVHWIQISSPFKCRGWKWTMQSTVQRRLT